MTKEFLKLENKLVLELEIEPISPLIIKLGDGSEEENSNKEKSESVISFVTSDSPIGNLVEYDKNKKTASQKIYENGFLKSEIGVHRLVRISPFDSNARRHTSFASVEIMPEFEDDLEIEIEDKDLDVITMRSSGAGGQHINKTDSAVRMTHKPTGITVFSQSQRSQLQNRETCLNMLKSKLLQLKIREQEQRASEIKGEVKANEWGSQIRSYVFAPYTMVKDLRTGYEVGNVQSVMDGDIEGFIDSYLRSQL